MGKSSCLKFCQTCVERCAKSSSFEVASAAWCCANSIVCHILTKLPRTPGLFCAALPHNLLPALPCPALPCPALPCPALSDSVCFWSCPALACSAQPCLATLATNCLLHPALPWTCLALPYNTTAAVQVCDGRCDRGFAGAGGRAGQGH